MIIKGICCGLIVVIFAPEFITCELCEYWNSYTYGTHNALNCPKSTDLPHYTACCGTDHFKYCCAKKTDPDISENDVTKRTLAGILGTVLFIGLLAVCFSCCCISSCPLYRKSYGILNFRLSNVSVLQPEEIPEELEQDNYTPERDNFTPGRKEEVYTVEYEGHESPPRYESLPDYSIPPPPYTEIHVQQDHLVHSDNMSVTPGEVPRSGVSNISEDSNASTPSLNGENSQSVSGILAAHCTPSPT